MRIRTGYSFRAAAGMLDAVMARLQEAGATYAPISDRASTFGWVRWNKLAKKAGLKPLFGLELAVTKSATAKKPTVDYWTFFAKDDIREINELLYLATSQFRYEPLLTYEQALSAKNVIKVVGSRSLLDEVPPQDDLYIALSPSVAKGYVTEALKIGHKFVASSDNKYVSKDDEGFYEVLCGRGASTQTYAQHILSESEWRKAVARVAPQELIDRSWTTATDLAASCNASLKTATLLSPEKPKTLEQMCRDGASKIGIDLSEQTYEARLQRELTLIKEKQFEDYFYIIADVMQFARQKMICGPARGSSCGSLVCYLLEITTIDPIKYGLLFERFIDITRNDLPDIDIDFSDQKRHLVFEYMERKYGRDHIARLGTVALFRPRSAIDEAATALSIPKWLCDRVLDSLIVRSGGDSRAMQTLEDTFNTTPAGRELLEKNPEILIAARMEGHPRHYSQHAAGIVVTETPVTNYVAVDARTGATHCDKKDAEDLNLLKIDALGLTQLSVFEDALTMAGKDIHYIERVPLDDKKAFDVLNKGMFSGIFQFNGPALQSICNQIKIESLADIVSVTALGRPGPLAGGGTNEWVKRKNGHSPITYPHPIFEPYLKETIGIITYQEQVMQICREVGDMSWADVSTLRKAMSKSLGKEFFDQYGNKFKKGAMERGVPAEVLEKVWDELCAYGAMGFNKSHAVAYGVVSYWCCYMKAHFPFEFAAATLSHEPDPAKQIMILREMAAEGIEYIPVDAELSTDKWSAGYKDGKKVLVGPIQNVKGIGPKLVQQIMSSRVRGEPLPARAEKLLANASTEIDSLWPVQNAFKRHLPDPSERNIHTPPTPVVKLQLNGSDYKALAFVVVQQIKPRDENEAVNVAKRGGKVFTDHTQSLNLTIADDTGPIFAKIDRFAYDKIGREIVERGRPGKALYAMKGTVPRGFRMLRVEAVRFIGFMDE
jgi:DNA polymerase III alpha subunit